jgi:hypothetical protein
MQAAFSGLQTFFKGVGEGCVQRGLQDVNDVKMVSQKGSSAGRDDEPAFRCFLWQWLCAHPPFPSARHSRASITVLLAARCDRYAFCSAPQNARQQLWSFRTSQGGMVLRQIAGQLAMGSTSFNSRHLGEFGKPLFGQIGRQLVET